MTFWDLLARVTSSSTPRPLQRSSAHFQIPYAEIFDPDQPEMLSVYSVKSDQGFTAPKTTTFPPSLEREFFGDTKLHHHNKEFILNLIDGIAWLIAQIKSSSFTIFNYFNSAWLTIPPGLRVWIHSILCTIFVLMLLGLSTFLSYCASAVSGSVARIILGYTADANGYPEKRQRHLNKECWRGLVLCVLPIVGCSISILILGYNWSLLDAICAGSIAGSLFSITISLLSAIICRIFVHSTDFLHTNLLHYGDTRHLPFEENLSVLAEDPGVREKDGDLNRSRISPPYQQRWDRKPLEYAEAEIRAVELKETEAQKQRIAQANAQRRVQLYAKRIAQADVNAQRANHDETLSPAPLKAFQAFRAGNQLVSRLDMPTDHNVNKNSSQSDYDPILYNQLRGNSPEIDRYANMDESHSGTPLSKQIGSQRDRSSSFVRSYRPATTSGRLRDGAYASTSRNQRSMAAERWDKSLPHHHQHMDALDIRSQYQAAANRTEHKTSYRQKVSYSNHNSQSPRGEGHTKPNNDDISPHIYRFTPTPLNTGTRAYFARNHNGNVAPDYTGTPVASIATDTTKGGVKPAPTQPLPSPQRSSPPQHATIPRPKPLLQKDASSQHSITVPRNPYATRLQVKEGHHAPPKQLW